MYLTSKMNQRQFNLVQLEVVLQLIGFFLMWVCCRNAGLGIRLGMVLLSFGAGRGKGGSGWRRGVTEEQNCHLR